MLKLARFAIKKANVNTNMLKFPRYFFSSAGPQIENADQSKDEPVEISNPFEKEKVKCILCSLEITPDYKNIQLLAQFQSPYTGRIYGRHITGLCKQKQEQVEKAIQRAQICAMMPYYHKDLEFVDDPKLFNPQKPIRPHKY